jgi:hypothetical protein
MNWHTRSEELQARYFRPAPYAYLWISKEMQGQTHWSFNFMDLGMCHSLSGRNHVSLTPTGSYLVDQLELPDETAALDAVFSGRYQKFVSQFYRDMRVFV